MPSHAERLAALSFPATSDSTLARRRAGTSILESISGPADVRALSVPDLVQLAGEVRTRIIDVIARKGGHFGAPLGAVDLTIALLNQFEVPHDKVVWDVGHQAYAWKILTGRNQEFETVRQYKGLSGFLRRAESPYDCFGAGHASTSISAALGIALGRDNRGDNSRVAAVIGDGSMTGGMAYEALNNAGLRKTRMLVVLNDNELSISENVWVVHQMFRKAVTHPIYNKLRDAVAGAVKKVSPESFVNYAHRVEESVKGLVVPGMFFEELGFRYIGPLDGHDIKGMVETLASIKDLPGPICMHVITQKGKGYSYAEKDPIKYHAAANMKVETGVMARKDGPPMFTKVFGDALVEIGRDRSHVVGITAAMDSGTGLDIWGRVYPDRFFDVGIAEECAVTMAAGMATEGLKPVCAIYSTFLQRAYDQIIHDVALQDLPVFFVLDRGGLVGADGPTHHGSFDLSYLRCVPGMVIMAPKDDDELRDMTLTGVEYRKGPIAMRYPRGSGKGVTPGHTPRVLSIGVAEVMARGSRVALVGIGRMANEAVKIAAILEKDLGFAPTVVNARFAKPLDETLLLELGDSHELVVTLEDNSAVGGFGSGVLELLNARRAKAQVEIVGLPDRFIEHGEPNQLYEEVGLMPAQIAERVKSALGTR